MSRTLCPHCHRPELACICQFITPVNNEIHVVVLQHPSEVKQVKGTVTLLNESLSKCQVIVDEDFSNNVEVQQLHEQFRLLLLYPGENARELNPETIMNLEEPSTPPAKPLCLMVLDGTWKKAYRMFMLSKNLQQLPQVSLPDYLANSGQYLIRKVAKKNALSSLEATCYALALLEAKSGSEVISPAQAGKYHALLTKFNDFNQFQLAFRPKAHRDIENVRKPNDS